MSRVLLYTCFPKKDEEKIQNILLPVIWFVVVFIFFSIASGKRDIYVLPLYPAAALITAWFLNEFVEQFREKHFKKTGYYPCYILCGVSLVLSILLPIVVYKTLSSVYIFNNSICGYSSDRAVL